MKILRRLSETSKETVIPSTDLAAERDKNHHLNNKEYNEGKIVLNSAPKVFFIQAAGPCNSNCAFCSRGRDYELFNLDIHKARFEEKLYPYLSKADTIIFTGSGEFLQFPNAEEILEHFDNRFPHVGKCFSTNGSSLTPKINEKIINSKSVYTIHVSLHASNSGLHKLITRTDNFDKILELVRDLLTRRKKMNKFNLIVKFIFVATTLNIEDLPNFVMLASRLGIDRVICYYNYIYVPAQKYLSCFFKQELTNKIFSEAEEVARRLNIEVDLPPRFDQNEYPQTQICSEPWSQIMLDAAGHVLPCDASSDCLESLDGKDFMEVWNGPYYRNLRKSLVNGTNACSEYCFRANPSAVNDFEAHVIRRGARDNIDILWGDNF